MNRKLQLNYLKRKHYCLNNYFLVKWIPNSCNCFGETDEGELSMGDEADVVFGKAITSRMFWVPAKSIINRSKPKAIPKSTTNLPKSPELMFKTPHGLYVDEEGNLWVTDVGLHQVFKVCFRSAWTLRQRETGSLASELFGTYLVQQALESWELSKELGKKFERVQWNERYFTLHLELLSAVF